MWNIAAQAGTGMAIAGLSATYYALIRKNVEMENRAMDILAADTIPKEEKRAGNEGIGDVRGSQSEYRMPTTASQNLLRKNFQLMAKESGRVFGINVAHSHALLVERNHSESDIDHIVNRTETFSSKSAVALGAKKSKSDFDILRKLRYTKPARKESSLDLDKSKSVFDGDTFAFVESSTECLSQQQRSDSSLGPVNICHCKYSASAEDIYVSPSKKEFKIEKCLQEEKVYKNIPKTNSPTVSTKKSTQKQMQGSLLSDDYIPRLENREFGACNLSLPATSSSKRSQEKEALSTQVIFPPENKNISKIPRLLKKSFKSNSRANRDKECEKSILEITENVPISYETKNDDEFPPPEKLLPLKIESELKGPLRVPDDFTRYSTSDLKSSKQERYLLQHASSSMFNLPTVNSLSVILASKPAIKPTKENNCNNDDLAEKVSSNNNHSPCILELSTANTWPMVRCNVTSCIFKLLKVFLSTINYGLNVPLGVVLVFAVAIISFAIFTQVAINAGLLFQEELEENPADAAFPEQILL